MIRGTVAGGHSRSLVGSERTNKLPEDSRAKDLKEMIDEDESAKGIATCPVATLKKVRMASSNRPRQSILPR